MVEDTKPECSWFKAALVRALKTFAQSAIALIPAGAAIQEISWAVVLGTAGLAALLSLLTSLAGLPECDGGPLDA